MKYLAAAFVCAALTCWGAQGNKHKLSPDLPSPDSQTPVRVVIQWNTPVGPATDKVVTDLGGKVISELKAVHGGVYTIPASALPSLEKEPSVKYVSPDRSVEPKAGGTKSQ